MKKPTPLQLGGYYHIYNRGINRENIFVEKDNYRYFLELFDKYILPIADVYAYCLLPNHFHFLVRIKTKIDDRFLNSIFVVERKLSILISLGDSDINLSGLDCTCLF